MLPQTVNRRVLEPKVPHKHAPLQPHRESMSRHATTAPDAANTNPSRDLQQIQQLRADLLQQQQQAMAPAPAPTFNFSFAEQDDDDDEDYEDEEDDEEDDEWLFAVSGRMELQDAREGFELEDSARAVRLNVNSCSCLADVARSVAREVARSSDQTSAAFEEPSEDQLTEAAMNHIRELTDEATLLVVFCKLTSKRAIGAVAQWLQCAEAIVVQKEEEEEESGGGMLVVLEGWKEDQIIGINLQNSAQNYSLPCVAIEGCEDESWLYRCSASTTHEAIETHAQPEAADSLTVIKLNANGWAGYKAVADALSKWSHRQQPKANPKAKGGPPMGIKKVLRQLVSDIVSQAKEVLFIVSVEQDDGWQYSSPTVKGASAAGFVCQLMQMVAVAVSETSDCRARAVLVGWTGDTLSGPDVYDVTATTGLQVSRWPQEVEDEEVEVDSCGGAAAEEVEEVEVVTRTPHTPSSTFVEDLERDIFHLIAASEYEKTFALVEQLPHGA